MQTLHRFVIVGGLASIVIALVLGLTLSSVFAQHDTPENAGQQAITATETPKAPVTIDPQIAAAIDKAVASNATAHQTWALALGAALSAGAGCLGAAYAVGKVGAAVMGAASEKPELLTRALVFVALGEGIAILGMVIAVLLYTKLPAVV